MRNMWQNGTERVALHAVGLKQVAAIRVERDEVASATAVAGAGQRKLRESWQRHASRARRGEVGESCLAFRGLRIHGGGVDGPCVCEAARSTIEQTDVADLHP